MIDQAHLLIGLHAHSAEVFEDAVQAAAALGPDGDRLLAGLDKLTGWRAVLVAAALGDLDGPDGGTFLRNAIATTGPGTADLRCAATLAIAKREREGASELLAGLVTDRNAAVRDYAMTGLAAYGDARAWDAALKRLRTITSRASSYSRDPSPVAITVVYLLRHLGSDVGRTESVRSILLKGRGRLQSGDWTWIHRHWPTITDSDEWVRVDPASAHAWLLEQPVISTPVL